MWVLAAAVNQNVFPLLQTAFQPSAERIVVAKHAERDLEDGLQAALADTRSKGKDAACTARQPRDGGCLQDQLMAELAFTYYLLPTS